MNQKMVVTNLRMEEVNYLAVKALAGEAGMSVNEYVNTIVWEYSGKKQLGIKPEKKSRRNRKSFWDIYKIMEGKTREGMGASEDDKLIYGIKDD